MSRVNCLYYLEPGEHCSGELGSHLDAHRLSSTLTLLWAEEWAPWPAAREGLTVTAVEAAQLLALREPLLGGPHCPLGTSHEIGCQDSAWGCYGL